MVPSADKTTGVSDSDLHIYVMQELNTEVGYVAAAGTCLLKRKSSAYPYRPAFGMVIFNTNYY